MKKLFRSIFRKSNRLEKNNKKIGVLIELDSFDKGGLQKVVLDIALRLRKDIFDVVIVSITNVGFLAEIAKKNNIKVYELPVLNKSNYLEKIIKENNIKITNSHFSNFGYKIYKKNNVKNITFIHNVYAFLNGAALSNFKNDDAYVDSYISVSPKATEYATSVLGINSSKVVTIPNGLIIQEHVERVKNAKPLSRFDLGLDEGDYVFLNPASYNLHKGHYLMADAMKEILKHRSDIKILCIGNIVYEPHYDQLKRYLSENGLERNILLPGYFPNVEDIYPAVDAFLMPSFIEGWSIAMNEAMFHEKPLIMTDTGGASDVIEGNDIGILLDNEYGNITSLHSQYLDELAYSPRAYKITAKLVEAIINFADNKDKWKISGKMGRYKILSRYDFDSVVEKYEKIFLKTIEA
jgi:glycosyltransferase involved in cell wall biosynthesis